MHGLTLQLMPPSLPPSLRAGSRGEASSAAAEGQSSQGKEETSEGSTMLHEPDADSAKGCPATEEREGAAALETGQGQTRQIE